MPGLSDKKILLFQEIENVDSTKLLHKVFTNICTVQSETEIQKINVTSDFDYFVIQLETFIKNIQSLKSIPAIKILLFSTQPIPLIKAKLNSTEAQLLAIYPCLFIEKMPEQELSQIILNFLEPEKTTGLTNILKPGSEIIAEKIQSLDDIGLTLDLICKYIEANYSDLKNKIYNIRQLITGLLYEAFNQAQKSEQIFPTVDFQFGFEKNKFAFIVRLPYAAANTKDLHKSIINAENLAWHMAWQNTDALNISHNNLAQELEAKAIILGNTQSQTPSFKSLLITKANNEKKYNLLAPIKEYKFKVLSELLDSNLIKPNKRHKTENHDTTQATLEQSNEQVQTNLDSTESNIALVNLKNKKLEEEKVTLNKLLQKKNKLVKELNQQVTDLEKIVKVEDKGLIEELKQHRMALEKLRADYKTEKNKSTFYKNQLDDKQNEISILQEKSKVSTGSNQVSSNELRETFELKLQEEKSKIKSLEEKIKELTKQNYEKDLEIDTIRKEAHRLEKSNEIIEAKSAEEKRKHEKQNITKENIQDVFKQQASRISELERENIINNKKADENIKKAEALEERANKITKELGIKEKELQETKVALLKAQKDTKDVEKMRLLLEKAMHEIKQLKESKAKEAMGNASLNANAGTNTKELEEKLGQSAQVIKTLNFKLQSADKNLTTIKTEFEEKLKRIEKKYDELKKKELDYIKKIEELTKLSKKQAA